MRKAIRSKALLVSLMFVMLFALAACGSKNNNEAAESTAAPSASAPAATAEANLPRLRQKTDFITLKILVTLRLTKVKLLTEGQLHLDLFPIVHLKVL